MAITLRSKSVLTRTSGLTQTVVPAPAGATTGDVIVVCIETGNSTNTTVPTPPTGWESMGQVTFGSSDQGFWVTLGIWGKPFDGATSWTWTHATCSSEAVAEAWQGVDTTHIQDATATTASNTNGNNSLPAVPPSQQTVTDGAMGIIARCSWDGLPITPPAGWTEQVDQVLLWVGDHVWPTAGTTNPTSVGTGDDPVQSNYWGIVQAALRPAGVAPTIPFVAYKGHTQITAAWYGGKQVRSLRGFMQPVTQPDGALHPRLDRGYGYSVAEMNMRTGIQRWGFSASDMTLYTGPSQVPSGTVLDKMLFTGFIDLRAGGVTITRSLFKPSSAPGARMLIMANPDTATAAPTKSVVRDCTFDGTLLTDQAAGDATAIHGHGDIIGCRMFHWGSGIAEMWGEGVSFGSEISSNYLTDFVSFGDPATTGNHSDGFTIRDFASGGTGRTMLVKANCVDQQTHNASGACFLQAFNSTIENVTFQKNLWRSTGWCISLGGVNGQVINYPTITYQDDRTDALSTSGQSDLTTNNDVGSRPVVINCYRYDLNNAPTYAGAAI